MWFFDVRTFIAEKWHVLDLKKTKNGKEKQRKRTKKQEIKKNGELKWKGARFVNLIKLVETEIKQIMNVLQWEYNFSKRANVYLQ